MQHDPNSGQTGGAPEPAAPPATYQQSWGQYAPPPPEMPAGQTSQGGPAYQPGAMPSMPSMPLPSAPYAPPSQPYAGYPGYPGYGWPANATAPSPYGYPGYPGYQAPAAPAPRRGLPVWAIVLISVAVVLVVAGGVFGAAAVLLRAEAGSLSNALSPVVSATSTASPTASPRHTFTDSLNGATNSGWTTSTNCFFKNSAYHITPAPSYGSYTCYAPAGTFLDFDMEVSAQEVSGPLNYGYGVSFRRQSAHNFYVFMVASNGEAWFGKYVNATFVRISPFWRLPDFADGLNAANRLRVTGQGTTFTFYVNDVQVGSVTDTTYNSGYVGLYAGETNLEAAFTNFSVTGTY